MSSDRSKYVASYIAKQIARNRTKCHWATLHGDALSDFERNVVMENKVIQHPLTDAELEAAKKAAFEALVNRVAELEKKIAALEGAR